MMKKLLFLAATLFIGLSSMAQEWPSRLPSLDEMNKINDSIYQEALILYRYEQAGWVSSDLFFENCKNKNRASGSITLLDGDTLRVVYFDQNAMEALYDYRVSITSGQVTIKDTVRPMDDKEVNHLQRALILMGKIMEEDIKIARVSSDVATFNHDIIRINDSITRVYFIMGALQPRMIPFGNDFSVDFNNANEVVAKRSYHHSFCPITWDEDKPPVSIVHSHTQDNPYMSPTDVCTFLLYGVPNGLKSFMVYSTAYQCYYLYEVDGRIVVIATSDEVLSRHLKKKKRLFGRRK